MPKDTEEPRGTWTDVELISIVNQAGQRVALAVAILIQRAFEDGKKDQASE